MIDTSVTYNGEDIFQEMTFKDRVESFFKYYNPEKLNDGDFLKTVLKTYENRKDILIEQLTSVYVFLLSTFSIELSMISISKRNKQVRSGANQGTLQKQQ